MAVTAGVTIGYAWSSWTAALWPAALLALALGVVCTLSAVRRLRSIDRELAESPEWHEYAAPPLGQMLLNYGLISEGDVDKALAHQKKSGKRLGQVLVEMRLVTHAQLAEVLEEQVSRREGRFLWGAGQRLVGSPPA
jgi:hypothetical protein